MDGSPLRFIVLFAHSSFYFQFQALEALHRPEPVLWLLQGQWESYFNLFFQVILQNRRKDLLSAQRKTGKGWTFWTNRKTVRRWCSGYRPTNSVHIVFVTSELFNLMVAPCSCRVSRLKFNMKHVFIVTEASPWIWNLFSVSCWDAKSDDRTRSVQGESDPGHQVRPTWTCDVNVAFVRWVKKSKRCRSNRSPNKATARAERTFRLTIFGI